MSYIDIKKQNRIEYAYFVKKNNLMGKEFRISQYIGKNVPTINKEDYLRRNLEELSKKELEFRAPLIEDLDICYSDRILFDVELLSIKINNLFEAKNNEDQLMVEFAKEFIFNSNNIEGSKIPIDEVVRIIETGDSRYQDLNEVKEVQNSIDAMNYIRKGFKFNIQSIKRLYYILSRDLTMVNGTPYPRGFKKVKNVINNMETVLPDQVEPRLGDLIENYRKNRKSEYPLKLAFDFHLRYEEIHPFLDGNGRTGRLIMNKILMNHGYFPVIIYTNNKEAYSNAISRALSGKGLNNYYQFMLKQAERTYISYYSLIDSY